MVLLAQRDKLKNYLEVQLRIERNCQLNSIYARFFENWKLSKAEGKQKNCAYFDLFLFSSKLTSQLTSHVDYTHCFCDK